MCAKGGALCTAVTPGGLPARYAREKRRNPKVGGEAGPLEGGRGRSGGHGERRGGVCVDSTGALTHPLERGCARVSLALAGGP